jgi:hypothetical protein
MGLTKHKGAIFVSAAANIGSVLFGFDTGVAGGVVALSRLVIVSLGV